jgi:hypothetical protein
VRDKSSVFLRDITFSRRPAGPRSLFSTVAASNVRQLLVARGLESRSPVLLGPRFESAHRHDNIRVSRWVVAL